MMPKVNVTKEFKKSSKKVFDAWLDTDLLSKWMFGPDVRDEEIIKLENNPVEDGQFSYVVMRGKEELDHRGTYRKVQRPNRLVFTWGVNEEAGDESMVTIDIEATKNGCQLTLVHELNPKWKEYKDRTREGWTFMLEKLETTIL
jgi:uncharacterized protein YndB with AHSA1/START domain